MDLEIVLGKTILRNCYLVKNIKELKHKMCSDEQK